MDSMKSVDGVHMHLENKSVSRKFFWMLWIMYAVVYMTKNCYRGLRMTGKSVIGLVLLTSTFLSSSVKAAALTSALRT